MAVEIKTTKRGYRQVWIDKKRVPSPSSVSGRFKESGGLIHWANEQGLNGLTLDEARDAATTPGSIVHDRIEADIRGHEWDAASWIARVQADELNVADVFLKVDRAWASYLSWREMTNLEPIRAELTLGSERHGFGGTLDAVAVSSKVHLLDWKTGNLYPDHLVQLGGYVALWEDCMDRPIDAIGLISVNKDHGGTTFFSLPREEAQVCVDQFLALLECYRRDKALKKMV